MRAARLVGDTPFDRIFDKVHVTVQRGQGNNATKTRGPQITGDCLQFFQDFFIAVAVGQTGATLESAS